MLLCCVVLCFIVHLASPYPQSLNFLTVPPTKKFDEERMLIPNHYRLFWKIYCAGNQSQAFIDIKVSVQTTGYIGFGLSPDGSMLQSDIVLTGVYPNGTGYITDQHSPSTDYDHSLDPQQDYFALSWSQKKGTTEVLFRRLLITCDDDNDLPIQTGDMFVIYAIGPTNADALGRAGQHRISGTAIITLVKENDDACQYALAQQC